MRCAKLEKQVCQEIYLFLNAFYAYTLNTERFDILKLSQVGNVKEIVLNES